MASRQMNFQLRHGSRAGPLIAQDEQTTGADIVREGVGGVLHPEFIDPGALHLATYAKPG